MMYTLCCVGYRFRNLQSSTIQNVKKSHNLEKEIRLTVVDIPPDIELTYSNESLLLGGFFGEVFNIFKSKFNVSFKITQNKEFGIFRNGNWRGMLGDLAQGRADICSGISMTSQRKDFIDFSPQLYSGQYDIIYRKLDEHAYNYKFYLQPYNMQMWLCIAAISLAVILLKVLANYISRNNHLDSCVLNFINELVLCWPIVLQSNLGRLSSMFMKLVLGIYIAFSMLLLIGYNSTLTSLLATRLIKVPFHSLEDMLENTNYVPVILTGSNSEDIFLNPSYENKSVLRVGTLIEGIESAYSMKFGFIASVQSIQHLIGSNCSFAVGSRFISREFISLGYSKQFAHKDFFNF
uniref:Ionotropic glutamate receptor L-glutamate and glycine-binding domain-containing protein n=1 Tax=Strigamia maritima TaxID=126957 RepID=T1JK51_STRMM